MVVNFYGPRGLTELVTKYSVYLLFGARRNKQSIQGATRNKQSILRGADRLARYRTDKLDWLIGC